MADFDPKFLERVDAVGAERDESSRRTQENADLATEAEQELARQLFETYGPAAAEALETSRILADLAKGRVTPDIDYQPLTERKRRFSRHHVLVPSGPRIVGWKLWPVDAAADYDSLTGYGSGLMLRQGVGLSSFLLTRWTNYTGGRGESYKAGDILSPEQLVGHLRHANYSYAPDAPEMCGPNLNRLEQALARFAFEHKLTSR